LVYVRRCNFDGSGKVVEDFDYKTKQKGLFWKVVKFAVEDVSQK
jgi:hypothetical protein